MNQEQREKIREALGWVFQQGWKVGGAAALIKHNVEKAYDETSKDTIETAWASIEAALPHWIACSERLPEIGEIADWSNFVLVRGYREHILRYDHKFNIWFDINGVSYPIESITHWQPLPAAPQDALLKEDKADDN